MLKSVTLWDQDQLFVWSLLIQSNITDLQSTLITGTAFKTKAGQRKIHNFVCIPPISVMYVTNMCETENGEVPSLVICIKNARARTCKVSLTRSLQDLIKPIHSYRAAIIPDLWTPSAGKSCWFSNSICPSLYRNRRVQVISLCPFNRRSWVVSVLKASSTYCSNKAECDSISTSKT